MNITQNQNLLEEEQMLNQIFLIIHKNRFKNAIAIYTSKFHKKFDLANLNLM